MLAYKRYADVPLRFTIAGFPNLFLLRGPDTGLGHNSVLLMIEARVSA